MRLTKQSSVEESWLVLTTQAYDAAKFPEPPAAANDAGLAGQRAASRDWPPARKFQEAGDYEALETARKQDRLLHAIKKAASWLMAQTVFGFAVGGAAVHPCSLDPTWSPYEHDPVEPSELARLTAGISSETLTAERKS